MPSITHEGPLDLVRQHPEIALELISGTVGVTLPATVAVSLAPTDMSAVVPVQYLADMVVLITDQATGEPALAVIIEPQLRDSETKRYSWSQCSVEAILRRGRTSRRTKAAPI